LEVSILPLHCCVVASPPPPPFLGRWLWRNFSFLEFLTNFHDGLNWPLSSSNLCPNKCTWPRPKCFPLCRCLTFVRCYAFTPNDHAMLGREDGFDAIAVLNSFHLVLVICSRSLEVCGSEDDYDSLLSDIFTCLCRPRFKAMFTLRGRLRDRLLIWHTQSVDFSYSMPLSQWPSCHSRCIGLFTQSSAAAEICRRECKNAISLIGCLMWTYWINLWISAFGRLSYILIVLRK
jgi:hypothetical protein